MIPISLNRPVLRNTSEWLFRHFVALPSFQFLMTSSEITERFSGLNKVPDKNDFTVVITSVVGWM